MTQAKRTYIVYVKSKRSEPKFNLQYVFATSAREAVATMRGCGFVVRDARLKAEDDD